MCRKGALPPATPDNPYLGEGHKNPAACLMPSHFSILMKPHFWAKNDFYGSPEPKYVLGGEGVVETPIVLKGLKRTDETDFTMHFVKFL